MELELPQIARTDSGRSGWESIAKGGLGQIPTSPVFSVRDMPGEMLKWGGHTHFGCGCSAGVCKSVILPSETLAKGLVFLFIHHFLPTKSVDS